MSDKYPPADGKIIRLEIERETDGRWIAEVMAQHGIMAYGKTPELAATNVLKLYKQVHGIPGAASLTEKEKP